MLTDDWIAQGALAKLVDAGLCSGNVEVDRGEPTDDEILPRANVFVAMDDGAPDGDSRTGTVRLVHTTKLVIEVRAKGNTQRDIKAWLAAVGEVIFNVLLSDRNWAVDADDIPIIEGFGHTRRLYEFPPEGNHVIGSMQVHLDIQHRSYWEPGAGGLHDFSTLNVDAGNGIGAAIDVPIT